MICGLTQSCNLQMMINHKQLHDFQSKINSAFTLKWNDLIYLQKRKSPKSRQTSKGMTERAQIPHTWNIYKHTPMCVFSAAFIRSHDGWSQPDQHVESADESLLSCMLIGCFFLTRPFRSIRGEHGGSTPCFGMYWLFSSSWKEPYQIPTEPRHYLPPPTTPPPPPTPNVLVSVHFRPDATKSIWLWQRSPRFQQPGGLGLLV